MPKKYCHNCGCEIVKHKNCRKCGQDLCKFCHKRQDSLCGDCYSEEDYGYLASYPSMDNNYAGFE